MMLVLSWAAKSVRRPEEMKRVVKAVVRVVEAESEGWSEEGGGEM